MYEKSKTLFARAQESIPGGVNSPVRAFKSVGGTPLFIKSAKGAYLYDEDGNQYIDYINSWGPMIMGHAYEPVAIALKEQIEFSLSFGAPTELEILMAELMKDMVPGLELVRMVNSGTEACMSALRLARGYTGRNKVIKFNGCYHGHADSFLVSAGSGVATLNIQSVPGITAVVAQDTLTAPYNDLAAVRALVEKYKDQVAAIIIEPVAGNMGCIPPFPDFLIGLRHICDEQNILLIFDEVMTGFRLAAGGAQELFGIKADIVTFGKIIGAGLPVGAYGGRREIMEHIAPSGNIYQAGTLSGNPLAMRAGYTLLKILKEQPGIYDQLEKNTASLAAGLLSVFEDAGQEVRINRAGSMISLHFSETPVIDFTTASAADNERFKKYFHHCLQNGIYLPPSPFETWFISHAITTQHIEHTLQATRDFLKTN
jgi:glutamate-1-semialdehyde 2,1-aminomutase